MISGCGRWKREVRVTEGLLVLDNDFSVAIEGVFDCLCKFHAPSKVILFSWKVLLNRIPTKTNLLLRLAIPLQTPLDNVLCASSFSSMIQSVHMAWWC